MAAQRCDGSIEVALCARHSTLEVSAGEASIRCVACRAGLRRALATSGARRRRHQPPRRRPLSGATLEVRSNVAAAHVRASAGCTQHRM
eukprot:1115664-Prymnesium_polylepis.2